MLALALAKRIGQVQESESLALRKLERSFCPKLFEFVFVGWRKTFLRSRPNLDKSFFLNWIAINELLVRGSGQHTCKSRARALPRTSLSVQVTFVFKRRQFSASQIVFRFWADGIMFARLPRDLLFKASLKPDCETKSLSGRSVLFNSRPRRNFQASKSQQSQSARAGGRVSRNLSRGKWKSVARERPRHENRRLPISESDWRRQNVQSRCGQCVGTRALHFLITRPRHD